MMHYFVLWLPKKFHECKSFHEADKYAADLLAKGKRGVSILTTSEARPLVGAEEAAS